MPLGMKNNIASINAINHLAKAQNELSDSLKRLSSGQRVNSGADDPSGLILSDRSSFALSRTMPIQR